MAKVSLKLSAADKELSSPQKDWPDAKVIEYLKVVRGMSDEGMAGFMRGWIKVRQGRSV